MYTAEDEKALETIAALARVNPAIIHGYVLIVHTHPGSGECGGHMETMTNVSPGMARTLAISYSERLTGQD